MSFKKRNPCLLLGWKQAQVWPAERSRSHHHLQQKLRASETMSVVGRAVQLKDISNLTPSTGIFCLPFFCMAGFHRICDTVSFFSSSCLPSPWLQHLSGEELLPFLPALVTVTVTALAQQTGQPPAAPPQHRSHGRASSPVLLGALPCPKYNQENVFHTHANVPGLVIR